ncbi:hypothetical protein LCGC14_3048430, partial [marine sediment metagenome]
AGKHHTREGVGVAGVSVVCAGDDTVIEVTRNTYERSKDKFALASGKPLEGEAPGKTTTQTRQFEEPKKPAQEPPEKKGLLGGKK